MHGGKETRVEGGGGEREEKKRLREGKVRGFTLVGTCCTYLVSRAWLTLRGE